MAAAMRPGSVWIERGPDGRAYFVRKKPKEPSLRQLLAGALFPRSTLSFFSRDSRQNNHIQCVNPETPLLMPPPSSTPAPAQVLGLSPCDPSTQTQPQPQQPQPISMYLVPLPQNQNKTETTETSAQSFMKPQQPFFPYPHPAIFPMPLPHPMPAQTPHFVPPVPHLANEPPFAAAPPQVVPFPVQQPQPQHFQRQLPTAAAAASDLRYKCEVCGRFRSARYHYEHPIPPGQLPGKTICRKCMEKATESEDESSSDSHVSRKSKHQASRARRWGDSLARSLQTRNKMRRARSSSRGKLIDNRYDRRQESSYSSDENSTSSDAARGSRRRTRSRRRNSPDTDIPERFRTLRLVPQARDVYFEHNMRHLRDRRYDEDSFRGDYDREAYKTVRSSSRPPIREPRGLHPNYPIHGVMIPQGFDHPVHQHQQGQFGEGPHVTHQTPMLPPHHRSVSRASTQDLYNPMTQHPHVSHHYEQNHYSDENDSGDSGHSSRARSGSVRHSRGRSKRRQMGDEEAEQSHDGHPRFVHVPNPPPIPSSLGYMAGARNEEIENCHGRSHDHSRTPRRRRSRSRPLSKEVDLRPGDTVTVIEKHRGQQNEDYDWYDEDGMRVRVREI